ncbi:MAG: ATP-binding protein, partial [Bdellovibrionales bacterium]|nr:ATP-binding protein [Bdellovibrionales bacterium]
INISKKRSFFLFGARSTGKTTLLQELFSEREAEFFDLLDPRILEKLEAYPSELEPLIQPAIKQKKIIVIDEIQRVPALLDIVHRTIQKDKAIFALTGSSARKLKRGSANLLAGRASIYNLFPLLFTEMEESFDLDSALAWGTLPELTSIEDDDEKVRFLQSYTVSYLQEEIVAEQIVRKLPPFRRFLQIASQMNSKVINYSKIASDINTDPSNVRNYFEIIEDTLLGFKLDSYHASIRKRQRHNPKFYWFDTGIVRSLQKFLGSGLNRGTSYYGELFESFLVNQIRAGLEYQIKQFSLSYLLTKDGAEIDLIVERVGEKTLCIEIKSSSSVRSEQLTNLKKLSADIENSIPLCLYTGDKRLLYDNVEVLPWQTGLTEFSLVPQ